MTNKVVIVHLPVILSGYTEATDSKREFVGSTEKQMKDKQEREDLHALGYGFLAPVSIILDRDYCTLLLERESLAQWKGQIRAFLQDWRGTSRIFLCAWTGTF
jgi:hypothetical protein